LKGHEVWLNESCSILLNQRKEAKLQRLQNQNIIIGNNHKNVTLETSRLFRIKKRGYLRKNVTRSERTVRTRKSEHTSEPLEPRTKGLEVKLLLTI
jgi:hypothetical protein